MKVLVACEFSGRVRDAFIAKGHDAISVDLLETEVPGPHIVGDAIEAVYTVKPDLLIAHPPCTYLANSGVRWLYGGKGTERDETRWAAMYEAADFFSEMLLASVQYIAVENPIMHKYGKGIILSNAASVAVEPTIQTIQPWQFGHGETKATQLWTRGLPPLMPTDVVDGRAPVVHFASPGPDRWRLRSRTYEGIAAAMADQWGSFMRSEQLARELQLQQVDRLARDLGVEL